MESENVKTTIEHVRSCPEAEYEDSKLLEDAKNSDRSSSSSVSSSFSRTSFELDVTENVIFTAQTPRLSTSSASPPIEFDDHSSQLTSPPIQTMGHPPGYDPNRIPSSVFSSKAGNESDWSIASNESLFSIHMGNGSFSRELWRSGELPKLDDWNDSQTKSNKLSSLPSRLPPVVEVSAHEEGSVKSSSASRVDNEGLNNSLKAAPGSSKTTVASPSAPRLSDESGRSSSSFAFPVLVSDGGKTASLERVEEKPEESQLQTQDSKATQRSSIGRWFSWFSCLPRCC